MSLLALTVSGLPHSGIMKVYSLQSSTREISLLYSFIGLVQCLAIVFLPSIHILKDTGFTSTILLIYLTVINQLPIPSNIFHNLKQQNHVFCPLPAYVRFFFSTVSRASLELYNFLTKLTAETNNFRLMKEYKIFLTSVSLYLCALYLNPIDSITPNSLHLHSRSSLVFDRAWLRQTPFPSSPIECVMSYGSALRQLLDELLFDHLPGHLMTVKPQEQP